jgi:hypothetical protein
MNEIKKMIHDMEEEINKDGNLEKWSIRTKQLHIYPK